MKITSVDIFRISRKEVLPQAGNWHPLVVRVNTDEGISGFGEVGLAYGNANFSGFGIARDMAEMVIGMDPMCSEMIWEKQFRNTFWGMGALAFAGISAIDVALWDIKGKALGVPVYQLLGGKTRSKLWTYASQIQFDWPGEGTLTEPAQYAEAALKAKALGYTAVKLDPIGVSRNGKWMDPDLNTRGLLPSSTIRMAYERVEAIRLACGDDMEILIELHALTDENTAIQLGRAIEQLRCFYMEEPTHPLNPDCSARIAEKVKIPLAGGERVYSRWGFRPFLERGIYRVIQPDLGLVGGITEGKKIADMAEVYDAAVQLHLCGGPISIAAAMQLEAVLPNFLIHEQHKEALQKENRETCLYDYEPENGYYTVPERPGIGQELTAETMQRAERYTVS